MEKQAILGESADFYSDSEILDKIHGIKNVVIPIMAMKGAHVFLSGALSWPLLLIIYNQTKSGAALAFTISAAIAFIADLVLFAIMLGQANYMRQIYSKVYSFPADQMIMESRAACLFYKRGGTLDFLRRDARPNFVFPMWNYDPYISLLKYYVTLWTTATRSPSAWPIVQIGVLSPWLLFYYIFGFYVTLVLWIYRAIIFTGDHLNTLPTVITMFDQQRRLDITKVHKDTVTETA